MTAADTCVIRQGHEDVEERIGDLPVVAPRQVGPAHGVEKQRIPAEKGLPEKQPRAPLGMTGKSEDFEMGIFLILDRLRQILHGSREVRGQTVDGTQVIRMIGSPQTCLLQSQLPGAEGRGVDVVDMVVGEEYFHRAEIEFPCFRNDPFPLVARIDDVEGSRLFDEDQKTVGLEGPHRKFAYLHKNHLSLSFPEIRLMTILPTEGWERIRSRISSSL